MTALVCPYCKKDGIIVKLELCESMMILCRRCSRLFVSKEYGKEKLYFGPAL
jgi:uncharacterized protein YbaR (Trm112 family)